MRGEQLIERGVVILSSSVYLILSRVFAAIQTGAGVLFGGDQIPR